MNNSHEINNNFSLNIVFNQLILISEKQPIIDVIVNKHYIKQECFSSQSKKNLPLYYALTYNLPKFELLLVF